MTRIVPFAAAIASLAIGSAQAVYLNPDGLGQALIYPYYTVQSANGNPYNTYISVTNQNDDAKAVRVRFREGRNSKEVFSFNLFLKPHDMWTGALVPFDGNVGLITADASCTDPALGLSPAAFHNASFTGANDDGSGTGIERLREGFVEMIEMATLPGGVPSNCVGATPTVAAPTGGLSGNVTLINVANGTDFTLNAEALADLASRPFFRSASDSYPDLNAEEISAVSATIAENTTPTGEILSAGFYRSVWTRPIDAVSAAFMRYQLFGEYILDSATRSRTDWVVMLPTRQFYVIWQPGSASTAISATAPFTFVASWTDGCGVSLSNGYTGVLGEALVFNVWDRETRLTMLPPPSNFIPSPPGISPYQMCAATNALDINNGSLNSGATTAVLGAITRLSTGAITTPYATGGRTFESGWLRANIQNSTVFTIVYTMTSLPASVRMAIGAGGQETGAHRYVGLPMMGFAVRTLTNGNLACAGGVCQGNYGAAFRLRYLEGVSP